MHYDPITLKNKFAPEVKPTPGKPVPNLKPLVERFARKRTR